MPSEKMEVTVLILWKDKTWEQREVELLTPTDTTVTELGDQAVKATMSNLAAIGKLDDVHTMGFTTGSIEVDLKEKWTEFEKENKEEDASTH